MEEHVYKHTRVTGTSNEGVEDAIRNAVRRTGRNVRNMRWFQVEQVRGAVEGGEVARWQVTLEIGFTVED